MNDPIKVMVMGAEGGMGREIIKMLASMPDMELVAGMDAKLDVNVPEEKLFVAPFKGARGVIQKTRPDVIVDFTTAAAVEENLPIYIQMMVPFIIGTTAWDTSLLDGCPIHGIVAPNMGPRLVAFQAALEYMAQEFPGIFEGFTGLVNESHQEWKEKPSGTGEAWRKLLERLGAIVPPMFIHRNKKEIHAFHSYDLTKGALGRESTRIQLVTDIDGRMEYVDGIAPAIRFLMNRAQHEPPRIYSMVNVLQSWLDFAQPAR